jgi:ribosomal protein S27AE
LLVLASTDDPNKVIFLAHSDRSAEDMEALFRKECPDCRHNSLIAILSDIPSFVQEYVDRATNKEHVEASSDHAEKVEEQVVPAPEPKKKYCPRCSKSHRYPVYYYDANSTSFPESVQAKRLKAGLCPECETQLIDNDEYLKRLSSKRE